MKRRRAVEKCKKNRAAIILIVLLGCGAMALTDAVIKPSYAVKSLIKGIFFLTVPLIYSCFCREISLKRLLVPSKKGFIRALVLGLSLYFLILGGYFLTRNVFDYSMITKSLTSNVGVDRGNFVFVALYISFFNSLLEEFFFRGFAFILLSKFVSKSVAFVFSALAFASYHIAMTAGWFSLPLFLLTMAGLVAGGVIFNLLDMKSENICLSWTVHMFANFAINTIGFILFGII